MATLDDLSAQLQVSCNAIDASINALANSLTGATSNQSQFVQSEIISLQVKKAQLQGNFVQNAMTTQDIQDAITQIGALTASINTAAQQIVTVTQAVQLAAQILGYVVQIASFAAKFV